MQFAVCRQNLPLRRNQHTRICRSFFPRKCLRDTAPVNIDAVFLRFRAEALGRVPRNFLASAAFTDIFADQIHHLRETDKLRPFCRRLVNPGACRLQILSFIILCIHLHQCHCISAYHKYPLYPVYKRFSLHNYLYFIIASLFHTGQPMQGTYARTVTRLLLYTHTCPVTEFAVASHFNTANSCCHHVFLRHFRFQKCLPVYSNPAFHFRIL